MKLAVIVLCFNDEEIAFKYVKTIYGYNSIDKIIVVDNGSEKEIYDKLENKIQNINKRKQIDIIRNERNFGYAVGNNIGAAYAIENYDPEIIMISNTDVSYTNDTVNKMIDFIEKNENIGLISPKMIVPDNKKYLTAWKLPTFGMMLWNSNLFLMKLYDPQEYKNLSKDNMEVDVLPGSLLMCSSNVWNKVKGFNEKTFLYGEESLLSYKVKKAGYKNYLLNELQYIHEHSAIINQNITSVKKKMQLLYEAKCIYNVECLKTNKVQNLIYKIAFKINTWLYIKYLWIKGERN